MSKLVSSLPCSHARQLTGSFFGKCPSPISDFILLKASSICQRERYKSSVCRRLQEEDKVVQREKYRAASNVSGGIFFFAFCWLPSAKPCARIRLLVYFAGRR